jgi:hypothetical protein
MLSKFGLSSLTRRQRLTLGAIAAFNFIVLGALAVLLLSNTPLPVDQPSGPDNSADCEQSAALTLRQDGVAGTVSIVGRQLIQVNITGPDAGAAWNALSMTVKMVDAGCGPYNLIRVDVPDPDGRPNTRLLVELSWPEVEAWSKGKFDDGQLSERMRRRLYETTP